tara:strand:- start:4144 stop:4938 length:795 start_codon:yes stop_codon:yes gene_type:complete
MVSENTEPVQAPLPEEPAPQAEIESNPLIAEVDKLNSIPDVIEETPAPETEVVTPVAETPPQPQTPAEQVLSAPEPPVQPTVPQQQMSPEQIQKLQQDQMQFQQVQAQAQLQNEAQRYQQQLEQQGYLPDQAQSIARQHMQSRAAQMDQARQNEFNTQVLLGKQAASEHFARQYKLTFEDMATLRMSNSPEQMEQVAKKISADRERDTELARLKQQQVPPQQFDNSQGAPEVASNDNAWLDRYIYNGDRSPNAVAAARRASFGQ